MALKRRVPRSPWDAPQLTIGEVMALKALRAGNANDGQQKIAYEAIVNAIAGARRLSFVGGGLEGDRASAFAEGRRWVGLMIEEACEYRAPAPKPQETGPHAVPKGAPPEA